MTGVGALDPVGFRVQTVRRAVLVTDVRHSSRRFADRPDEAALRINRDLERFAAICAEHGGLPVRDRGDGLMMTFEDPRQALLAAVAMQRDALEANAKRPKGAISLLHRIGAHIGPVSMVRKVVEAGFVDQSTEKFTGDTVVIADRLQAYCHPGEVCFSNEMYQEVKDLPIPMVDLHQGEHRGLTIHAWSTRLDPNWLRPLTVEEQAHREREKELERIRETLAREQRETQRAQDRRTIIWVLTVATLLVLAGIWGPEPVRGRIAGSWNALVFGPPASRLVAPPEPAPKRVAAPVGEVRIESRAANAVADDPELARSRATLRARARETLSTLRFGAADFDRSTDAGLAAGDEAAAMSDWMSALGARISGLGRWPTSRLGRLPGMQSGVPYQVAGVVDDGIELVPTVTTIGDRVPPNVRVPLRRLGTDRVLRLGAALGVPDTARARQIVARWRKL